MLEQRAAAVQAAVVVPERLDAHLLARMCKRRLRATRVPPTASKSTRSLLLAGLAWTVARACLTAADTHEIGFQNASDVSAARVGAASPPSPACRSACRYAALRMRAVAVEMEIAVLLASGASCSYPPSLGMHSPSLPELRQCSRDRYPGPGQLFKRGGPQNELEGWQPLNLHLSLVLSLCGCGGQQTLWAASGQDGSP